MVEYVSYSEEEEKNKTDESRKSHQPSPQRNKGNRFFNWKVILLLIVGVFLLSSLLSSLAYQMSPKIAVLPVKGAITAEQQVSLFGSTQSSRDIADLLYSLRDDDTVKGVILDINSPGGTPVASDEISRAVEAVGEDKPVYALIGDTGASGAYWIASSADKIYSSSMSTVGSIGATSSGFGFEDFIKDYNISYRELSSGEHKEMGSPFKEMSEKEEQLFEELLDRIHGEFVEHVATQRDDLSYNDVDELATGEIFLGSQGIENGLVDELGYFRDVKGDMRDEVGDHMIVELGRSENLWTQLGVAGILSDPLDDQKIMLSD